MKARTRKLLSLLLTLCMVIGLLPGMALTAAAASDPYVTVNNNVYLSEAKPYYVNGKAQADNPGDDTFGRNGYTAKLTLSGTDATLTLKGYNGGRISAWGSRDARISLTVVVDGANTITTTSGSGIYCGYGDLTVKGATENKNTDALAITSANSCVEAYQGNLTIQDLKELNAASTATNNTAISVMFGNALTISALTISNIGTMKVSIPNIGGGYTAVSNRDGSVSITDVDNLEVYSGGNGIRAAGSSASPAELSITKCGKVMLYGGSASSAIEGYQSSVMVSAGTVVAIGGRQAVNASGGDISIEAENTLYLNGGSSAVYGSGTVTVKKGEDQITGDDLKGETIAPAGEATISITASKSYDGQPFDPAPSAKIKDTEPPLDGMTYLYSWYDSAGNRLSTAPTDAGTYKLTVYGYNNTYAGTLENQTITISQGPVPTEYVQTVSANIGQGYNVITLPEIPSGMKFGTITAGDDDTLTDLTIAGNLLSFQAGGCTEDTDRTVTIQIPDGGNYKGYTITLNLKQLANQAVFDRCDGSKPAVNLPDTTLYNASGNPDGAWEAAIGDAKMYGYEFAGWYTAPNGWGTQVSDKNGKDPADPTQPATFIPGTTYYAKWVWTRSYVDAEAIDGNYYNVKYVYGVLSKPRTVYTTCLDFTKNDPSAPSAPSDGDGYKWENNNNNNKTLILDGVHIQALDSVCGIILPAKSTIKVVSMPKNSYNEFYKYEEGREEETKTTVTGYADYSKASNIISCGSLDATADVFCLGSLTIDSDVVSPGEEAVGLGNWLNTEQGGIRTARGGTLIVDGANIDTTRLHADGAITVDNSLIFATNFSSKFTGDRYVRSYNGSVTIQNGWVFTEWLQAAEDLSISGKVSRIRASFGASAGKKITISNSGYKNASGDNFALDFGGEENALWGLCAKNIEISGSLLNSASIMTEGALTVSGGSEVNAHSSQMALPICIYGGGSISNSTVNVTKVDSGSVGIYSTAPLTINKSTVTVTKAAEEATPAAAILVIAPDTGTGLALNSATITAPAGATVEKLPPIIGENTALWCIVKSDESSIADEVTIVPVSPPSSGGSSLSGTFSVSAGTAENGSVSVSPKNAAKGTEVTVTIKPDAGFVLDKLTVTDGRGNVLTLTDKGNGQYAFTMPAGMVKVNAEFKQETTAPAYESFTDLKKDTWYQDGVQYVLESRLMDGVGDGKFAPNVETSRAMVATILWRLAGSPQAGASGAFTDVASGTWYSDAAAWAAENGIANGNGGAFDPNGAITREQLACMLYRYAQSQGKGFSGEWMMQLSYADSEKVSSWAYEAMCWCTTNGILNGKDGNRLDPAGQASRAEAATMLLRFAESMK